MKLYAELPFYRTRQVILDAAVTVWILVWAWIGRFMFTLAEKLAGPGHLLEDAGSDLRALAARAVDDVEDVPAIGDTLAIPFREISDTGRLLQEAGQNQQDVVHTFALWLGVLLALIPILLVLLRWLPWRVHWIREATAAHGLRVDDTALQIFALRALATRPLWELRRATPTPAQDYSSGNFAALAALELHDLGLRAPPP
ncbi:MAG TPA: hypothetical protein VNC78_07255 [Actinomycetota bacterium]|nr:hypothetical protein [Actinomycetota bacterium]